MMSSEAREGSFPDLLKISENTMLRRNDSELAFQDFLKRIPSSSNLPYLSSGGPSMGNLLDAAMPPPGAPHAGDAAPVQRENSLKTGGLMSGMPRVSSLDFLARLVCSNPMPAAPAPPGSGQLQAPGSSSTGAAVKLEPLSSGPPNGTLSEDGFRKTPPATLALPNMSPMDLQGLSFPSSLSTTTGLHGIPGLQGLSSGLPAFAGLPSLPGAGGLELGGLPNGLPQLHLPHPANPAQAAAAALQLQGQLAHAAGGVPQASGSRPAQAQQGGAPSGQAQQGAAGNSGRHSSKPSSTGDTGTVSEESDGADNQKGGRGGGPNSKRARRMLSNRESARRSRKRKQEHLSRLEAEIQQLKESKQQLQESNQLLNQQYVSVNDHNKRLRDENDRLRDELQFLRTEIQCQRRRGAEEEDEKKQVC